jgi:hypothetical protein
MKGNFILIIFLIGVIYIESAYLQKKMKRSEKHKHKKIKNRTTSNIYELGYFYKADYNEYLKIKENFSLDPRKNFFILEYINFDIGGKLNYNNNQVTEICNISNIKFIWGFQEINKNEIFNENCIMIFDRKEKNEYLLCATNIENKILLLNLIYQKVMDCDTKLVLLNINNRNNIHNKEKIINNIYFSEYIINKSQVNFYKRIKDDNTTPPDFKQVSTTISNFDIQTKPDENDDKNIFIPYQDLLCDNGINPSETLLLKVKEARILLNSDFIDKIHDNFFDVLCRSINPCKNHSQSNLSEYIFCFDDEDSYLKFEENFMTSIVLFHFINRWTIIWDKLLNSKENLNKQIDKFIQSNLNDENSTNDISKPKINLLKNPDYNKIYKSYRYYFKKPISNDQLLLKDGKSSITPEKKCRLN